MSRALSAALIAAAVIVTNLVGSTGASAVDGPVVAAAVGATSHTADGPDVDTYVAGYTSQLSGFRRSAVATVVIPTLGECGAKEEGSDVQVRLDSLDGQTWAGLTLMSFCHNGLANHYAEFNSSTDGVIGIDHEVADGDRISLSSKVVGNRAEVDLVIKNLTQGWTASSLITDVRPDEAQIILVRHYVLVGHMDVLRQDTVIRGASVSRMDLAAADPVRATLVRGAEGTKIRPSRIRSGTNFTFKYVPIKSPAPTHASPAGESNTGGQLVSGPSSAPAPAEVTTNFKVFRRPVPKYTDHSCPADFSTTQDGAFLESAVGCGISANFSNVRKYSVPDGGWLSWGSPPDTEDSTPAVAATLEGVTSIAVNYSHRRKVGGVEVQPDPFKRCSFTVSFFTGFSGEGDEVATITRTADGRAGAKLFGSRVSRHFHSIVITSNDGVGFAIAQVRA